MIKTVAVAGTAFVVVAEVSVLFGMKSHVKDIIRNKLPQSCRVRCENNTIYK